MLVISKTTFRINTINKIMRKRVTPPCIYYYTCVEHMYSNDAANSTTKFVFPNNVG